MHTSNLYNQVLLEPLQNKANKLLIVSGYATAAMAFHHMNALKESRLKLQIELLVGMTAKDGISESNHKGLQYLMEHTFKGNFACSYVATYPPIHSKVYAWLRDDEPLYGSVGSANYTQTAFIGTQRECVTEAPATECFEYFKSLIPDSIYCTHMDVANLLQIYKEEASARLKKQKKVSAEENVPEKDLVLTGLNHVKVSLLDRSGNLPSRSGLNWEQRPEQHREPNQAYIKLTSDIYRTDFFPERTVHFTIQTDDDKILIATRAQDNGKAIHTPHNNSLIGEYFRNRLGVGSGALVTKQDLVRYGRTDINFYKIDDETFYMDFSSKK